MRHDAQLIFVFLVEMGFHHVDQDGLENLENTKDQGDCPENQEDSAKLSVFSDPFWPVQDIKFQLLPVSHVPSLSFFFYII